MSMDSKIKLVCCIERQEKGSRPTRSTTRLMGSMRTRSQSLNLKTAVEYSAGLPQ